MVLVTIRYRYTVREQNVSRLNMRTTTKPPMWKRNMRASERGLRQEDRGAGVQQPQQSKHNRRHMSLVLAASPLGFHLQSGSVARLQLASNTGKPVRLHVPTSTDCFCSITHEPGMDAKQQLHQPAISMQLSVWATYTRAWPRRHEHKHDEHTNHSFDAHGTWTWAWTWTWA